MQGVEGTGGDDGDGGGVALDAGISTVAGGRWVAGCKDGEVEANDAVLRESGAVTVVANPAVATRRVAVACAPRVAPSGGSVVRPPRGLERRRQHGRMDLTLTQAAAERRGEGGGLDQTGRGKVKVIG